MPAVQAVFCSVRGGAGEGAAGSLKLDVNELDRRFRLGLVGATVLCGMVRFVLDEENAWVHALFIVLMAGNVGYFTNFLAIKMLFQPKQGRVLGWSGLVPRNKPEIARSLAESVQTQLLSPDIILDYIHEQKLIDRATERLGGWVDGLLDERAVRGQITTRLVQLLRRNGDAWMGFGFDQAESLLLELAADPDRVRGIWVSLRERLAAFLRERENRERLVTALRDVLEQEIPRLAALIDGALESYLREREAVGAVGRGLKRFFSVDRDAIGAALERFVQEPEASSQLMEVLDTLVQQAIDELGSEEIQHRVISRVESWVGVVAGYAREHLLPLSVARLQDWLDQEASWQQIDQFALRAIRGARQALEEKLASKEGQEAVKGWIQRAVRQINVTDLVEEQVMKLDTDELEDLILNNTGGNLVVIQILGGTLGLVAGFVQVDIRFAFPLLAFMGVVYVAFRINQRNYG